jgi:hypothetical protein
LTQKVYQVKNSTGPKMPGEFLVFRNVAKHTFLIHSLHTWSKYYVNIPFSSDLVTLILFSQKKKIYVNSETGWMNIVHRPTQLYIWDSTESPCFHVTCVY